MSKHWPSKERGDRPEAGASSPPRLPLASAVAAAQVLGSGSAATQRRRAILAWSALACGAVIYLLPVLLMVVGSFKPDERVLSEAASWRGLVPYEASLDNYRDVFARVAFTRFMFNSLLITGLTTVLGLLVNSMLGYALARLHWRGRQTVQLLILALLVIPFEAIAVPLFVMMVHAGWTNTYHVQIVPFIANPFSIVLFATFFAELPRELEEAARLDGCSTWGIYWRIAVPLSLPAFASVAILSFLLHWGAYLWPLMVTRGPEVRPLPVAIGFFTHEQPVRWGDILAFATMMVLPVVIVFITFQRAFVRGLSAGAIKG